MLSNVVAVGVVSSSGKYSSDVGLCHEEAIVASTCANSVVVDGAEYGSVGLV